jgi:hypothetical protein
MINLVSIPAFTAQSGFGWLPFFKFILGLTPWIDNMEGKTKRPPEGLLAKSDCDALRHRLYGSIRATIVNAAALQPWFFRLCHSSNMISLASESKEDGQAKGDHSYP